MFHQQHRSTNQVYPNVMPNDNTGLKSKCNTREKGKHTKKDPIIVTSMEAASVDNFLEDYYNLEQQGLNAYLGYAHMDILDR